MVGGIATKEHLFFQEIDKSSSVLNNSNVDKEIETVR